MSPIPGLARKRTTPATRWRRRFRRRGRTWTVLAANLPNKRWLRFAVQVAWVRAKMVRVDAMTIAECTPRLAGAINRLPGLHVTSAHPNDGNNGNVVVSKGRRPVATEFRTIYTANNGHHTTLNMARARISKGRTELTVDAVHFPSRGGYASSSSREQRAKVIRQVVRRKAVTRDRVFAGDINDDWRWVLAIAQDEDPRWRHLGGDGVEHVFGIVTGRTLGQRMLGYKGSSDHKRTARVNVGILNRS